MLRWRREKMRERSQLLDKTKKIYERGK